MNHHEGDYKEGCIRTLSGKYISLTAPKQEDIVLVDVAHGLAGVNRYCSQSPQRYNDAQHSVLVSHLVAEGFELEGLFHDAPEAYIGDVSGPLKHMDGMKFYRDLEDNVWYPAIAKKFGLLPQVGPEVKYADQLAYRLECAMLFDETLADRLDLEEFLKCKYLLEPWPAQLAEEEFLDRYWQLQERKLG